MRKYRRADEGHRICNRCETQFPATIDFFVRDSTRAKGLTYECRACHAKRKKGRDRRKERWAELTTEQRVLRRAVQAKYNRTPKGRAVFLRAAYKKIDACDLTVNEVFDLIIKPCVHCGTTDINRGLDRIDNSLPHVKGNVVPACAPCNFARGDRFSFEEMQRIGAVIRAVLQDRTPKEADSEGHL